MSQTPVHQAGQTNSVTFRGAASGGATGRFALSRENVAIRQEHEASGTRQLSLKEIKSNPLNTP